MSKGRGKGRAAKKNAQAQGAIVSGLRVKVKAGSAFAGECGEIQSSDGAVALVKLDCKDVAQAIPHENLQPLA